MDCSSLNSIYVHLECTKDKVHHHKDMQKAKQKNISKIKAEQPFSTKYLAKHLPETTVVPVQIREATFIHKKKQLRA